MISIASSDVLGVFPFAFDAFSVKILIRPSLMESSMFFNQDYTFMYVFSSLYVYCPVSIVLYVS